MNIVKTVKMTLLCCCFLSLAKDMVFFLQYKFFGKHNKRDHIPAPMRHTEVIQSHTQNNIMKCLYSFIPGNSCVQEEKVSRVILRGGVPGSSAIAVPVTLAKKQQPAVYS